MSQLSQENIPQQQAQKDVSPTQQKRSLSPTRAGEEGGLESLSQQQSSGTQQSSVGQQESNIGGLQSQQSSGKQSDVQVSPKSVHEENVGSSQESSQQFDYFSLIKGFKHAMITTRRQDGTFNSRLLNVQKRKQIQDLYFVCNHDTTLEDIENDNNVSISYYRDQTNKWVAINGTARICKDRDMINKLYTKEWQGLFDNLNDGTHDCSQNDPRFVLIMIDVNNVTYSKQSGPTGVISSFMDKVKKPFESLRETALRQMGIERPTPIQERTIDAMLKGEDLFVVDQTGTGKSFALMCSIMQHLYQNNRVKSSKPSSLRSISPLYLVVTPNRELAWQFGAWLRELSTRMGMPLESRVQIAVAGIPQSIMETELYTAQPDILVGTPSIIYPLLTSGRLMIDRLEIIVLDEADLAIQALSRYATLREKENRKEHPLDGALLLDEITRIARKSPTLSQPAVPKPKISTSTSESRQDNSSSGNEDNLITKNSILSLISQSKNKPAPKKQPTRWRKETEEVVEPKKQFVRTNRRFQTIFSSATLSLRLRMLIHDRDWVNEDAVLVSMRAGVSKGYVVPASIDNRFISVGSENGMLNAMVMCWRTMPPAAKAIGIISNDGSVDRVVKALISRGINAKPLTDLMDFDSFNLAHLDADSRAEIERNLAAQNRAKAAKVGREIEERSRRQAQRQATRPPTVDEIEEAVERIDHPNKSNIVYVGKEQAIRGIDLGEIGHVYILNVELDKESYLHMAGRCGRMGRSGHVTSIYNAILSRNYENVMKFFGEQFNEEVL
eukprot:gene11607-13550_t